ncbi:MAG: hypothetical protein ACFFGZ_05835 [Candidatus Thorarchaeota archaeon]
MIWKNALWAFWTLMTVVLLLIPNVPASALTNSSTEESVILGTREDGASTIPLSVDYYDEHGQIWINPEGSIDSEVRMEGSDVVIGDYDLNQLPASLKNILKWADFSFWQTGDPNEMNGNIWLQFATNSFSEGEAYGQTILELLNQATIVDWEHTGTWGWDEYWYGSWTQITTVEYKAHIDWPWFMDVINSSIPRGYGGLAATVDLSEANSLWFWGWLNHDSSSIYHGLGARWNTEADSLTGGFSFSAKELLHVSTLQVASHDDSLQINWELPDIQNLATNPSVNSSNWDIYTHYHPNEEEPWNKYNHYTVWMDLYSSVTDFQVTFDYAFLPWELQNCEEFQVRVDPYGYLKRESHFNNHSFVDLSGIAGMDEVSWLDFSMNANETTGWDTNTFWLTIRFTDTTVTAERNTTAQAIAHAYEAALGGTFQGNNSEMSWEHDPDGNYAERFRWHYWGDANLVTKAQMDNALLSSSFYTDSVHLQEYGIADWTHYWEGWSYRNRMGGYWTQSAHIFWSPYESWIAPPTGKTFVDGVAATYNLTATSLWNWANLSKSPSFDRFSVGFQAPIYSTDDSWDTRTNPDQNNGFGYNIGKWDGRPDDSVRVVDTRLDVYTEEPWVKDNSGANVTKLEEFELFFNYSFFSEDEDLGAPWSNIRVMKGTDEIHEDSHEWNEWKWNDTQTLAIYAADRSYGWWWGEGYYWDETAWEARYGVSDIADVGIDLYFSDLPVDDPMFHRSLSTSYDSPKDRWYATWDTANGQFADGDWTITTEAEDDEGYTRTRSYQVVVDNYADDNTSFLAPNVTVTALDGVDSVWDNGGEEAWNVSGRVRVQINITDDIGVFAGVFTADFGGWILDADYEVYNESPTLFVYEFEWDSRLEAEDSIHFISIESWDIDGHTTTVTYYWQVDNFKPGNKPTMDIISPSSPNENITGMYLLQLNVTDDFTPLENLSVSVAVDDRTPLAMTFNPTSEYFELLWNSSTVVDGNHTLTFKVLDPPNNHAVQKSIDIETSNGIEDLSGDPPEWKNFIGTSDLGQLVNYTPEQIIAEEYESHAGEISFEISVTDDNGIDSVQIAIYKVPSDALDLFSKTIDENKVRQNLLGGFPKAMTNVGTLADGYTKYTHTWDSADEADNLWVVEITIADIDDPQNVVAVHINLFTDNFKDQDPEVGVPGFEMVTILLGLSSLIIVRTWRKRTRA